MNNLLNFDYEVYEPNKGTTNLYNVEIFTSFDT